MKILFFSSQLLFEETRFGGAKRLYHFARELEKRHELHLICLDGCAEVDRYPPGSSGFRNFLVLPDALKKKGLDRWLEQPIDVRGGLERSRGTIEAFLEKESFDAVFLAFPFALSFLDRFVAADMKNITYLEDDLFLEFLRQGLAQSRNPFRRLIRRLRYRMAIRFYGKILRRVGKFAGISAEENAIMKMHHPWIETHLLKYGIELARHPLLPARPPLRLGYIGNYRHRPNADALEHLLKDLWPVLKKGEPGLELFIAGVGIPNAIRSLHQGSPGIHWMEDVPDLQDFYREVGLFINPIISGRGMRTKLIEAAAFGRPLLSTPLGAEGAEDLEIELAETPLEFLAACRKHIQDPKWSASVAVRNRAQIERFYDIAGVARQLERLLE